MNQLQKALLSNVLFSGICGILLLVLTREIADLFNVSNTMIFLVLGIALIVFAATIVYIIRRQKPIEGLIITMLDFAWVIGSIALLVLQPFEISKTGNGIIAVVALFVLIIALTQAKAIAQVDHIPGKKKKKQLKYERTVKASKEKVWPVISDVAHYYQVAPNIDDVKILSGEGEGMVRNCSHGKDSWTETCTLWEKEKEYAFEVNTIAPDYPYPFKTLKGNWKIEEKHRSETKIIMIFEFEYKKKFQNWLLHPMLKENFNKIAEELLDNWQKRVEQLQPSKIVK